MENFFYERTLQLLGEENYKKLQSSHVAVFGLGGVGSYALEALIRTGIGTITIVDFDKIEESNINRQILATYPHIGRYKVDVAEERMLSINPKVIIHKFPVYINLETLPDILQKGFHFAIDAIDTLRSKVELLISLYKKEIYTVSCMGAGMKLDPLSIKVNDISKTHTCPLARKIRTELRKQGITHGITCVYSTEIPKQTQINNSFVEHSLANNNKKIIGSISYIPGIFGLISAGVLIQKILYQ